MKIFIWITLCTFFVFGFFCFKTDVVSVFVNEGDSVTLNTGVETDQQEKITRGYGNITWTFKYIHIAEITGDLNKTCTDVQCNEGNERFRDRLKLVNQTGSLTITNITNRHSGLYELEIYSRSNRRISGKTFFVSVRGFLGVGSDGESVFVKEGDSVTLHTNVKTIQKEEIHWYFNLNTHIAQITGDLSYICTDVQCNEGTERFRDRLKLDNQTGSLTITNITNTDSGLYEMIIFSRDSGITKNFGVSVRGVSAAERDEVKRKSVKERESITLDPGVTKNPNDLMTWYFNDTLIAEISGDQSKICTDDQCEERFRDRLKLDHQTGSLTITNTRTEHAGDYTVKIRSGRFSITRSFRVSITGVSGVDADGELVFVKKGDSVTLHTGVQTNQQENIIWYFNGFQITQITGDLSYICADVQCYKGKKRFRDRLKLDHQTGSLTITNIQDTDSGEYKLQIISSNSEKTFSFFVFGVDTDEVSVSVKEGDSVTLHTGVQTNQQEIIKWYYNDICIAQINGDLSFICTDVQCDNGTKRFRDRLKLDHQTGSLTITNIIFTESGLYKLQIISSRFSIIRNFTVTVFAFPAHRVSVSVMEGDSVTLHTGVETKQQDRFKWYFNGIRIAEISGDLSFICTDVQCDNDTERFRDRLELDHQTGSLTITDTRNTDAGDYTLEIIFSSVKIFSVSFRESFIDGSESVLVSLMEGDSVTLYTDVTTNQQEIIKWFYLSSYIRIAQIRGDLSFICTDVQCNEGTERFRDRLKLDHQTGSLTITNFTTTDSGDYELLIISSRSNSRIFNVSVHGVSAAERDEVKRKSVKKGKSVTLDPGEIKNPDDVMTWCFNDPYIDQSKICTDVQSKERFRDRLKVNQTGSLTITNIRTEHAGDYRLQINNSRFSIIRSFSVSVTDPGLSPAGLSPAGLSPAVKGGICVAVILLVATAAVIYFCKRQSSRKGNREQFSDHVRYYEH